MQPTFQLSMTKRRKRAGLLTLSGEPTDTIFLRHGRDGAICWEQCDEPAEAATGRYRTGRPTDFKADEFRKVLEEFGGVVTAENLQAVADKTQRSTRTIWRWWKKLSGSEL